MKKIMKTLTCGALVAALVFSLAACGDAETSTKNPGSANSEADDQLSIGIVVKTATNAHFQDIAYGAVLAGKDLGVKVLVDNTTTESDVDGQITKCENFITLGCDAIVLTPNDSDGVATAVEAAYDAGIPFVTSDTQITNVWGDQKRDYIPNFVGAENSEISYNLACKVFDEMGGKGNVVILRGMDAASSSQERTAGFEKAINEYPGITLIESQSANYDQNTAQTTMADIVQAHKDIDAILCCNDMMAVGACNALVENNIPVGQANDGVLIAGIDGNIIALEAIERGEIYATAYDWAILWGYLSVMQAYDLIQGKEVPEFTMTKTDCVITAENLSEYMPHSLEVADWSMGAEIDEVSDYMRTFVETGIDGITQY